ncbi:MAG: TonB-dependent receptor plug domain-containing protein [Sphingobacteriales bacterium]
MKKILLAALVLCLSFQPNAYCQNGDEVLNNGISNLKDLLTNHIIEKAYLHFDRQYACYVAGEVVYFKAYVTKGELHELSDISATLHVDLINKNDVILQSIALPLNKGTGWGDFALSDTLKKGSYRIRAYTAWMRTDKHPYFFDQYISVSSISNPHSLTEAIKQGLPPSLEFYPEGGSLVTDIHSKVAFKAIGPDGTGINVNGVVVDNENKEVAKIASAHLGMGVFDFIPEEGRTYKAKVTFADGSQSSIDLPAAEEKGISLSVNTNDPSKVSVEIRANRAYYKENKDKQLNLLFYYSGSLKRYTPKLDGDLLGLDLPANTFPTGVLQVTLLSGNGEPLNERLAFIQNPDLLNLSVAANKSVFSKRENVQLSLNAKNKDGNPVNGSFSVSVIDESKILVDENAESSILSYLLLTTEVKGYVEKPNYYFANVNKETRANLDALMLTQGYRRFVWKELFTDYKGAATTYLPDQYVDIAGVLKTKAGIPLAGAKVMLLPLLKTEVTDAQGRFRFEKMEFNTGTRYILKVQGWSGKNSPVLTMDKPDAGPVISSGNSIEARYNPNADILASFQTNQTQGFVTAGDQSTKVLLKDDKVISHKKRDNYKSSKLGGSGNADQVITADQIPPGTSLSESLEGIVHGVYFNQGLPYLNGNQVGSGGSLASQPMTVIIDGSPSGSVDNITPSSVETVEVLKGANAGIYGIRAATGVLVITTKQTMGETSISKETAPGIFSISPRGFYKAREFYAPRYDAGETVKNAPDQRTTIFWKPDVSTDADGNATFNFFNADGTGNYRVVIEGIDSKGNLGRQVFRYKVE